MEEAFDHRCGADVKADIPMYSTPHGLLMVPPPAPPPPTAGEEAESSDPGKEKRKFLRRLETALNTLRKNLEKKSNDEVADDDLLLKTLENAVSAKKSYMHHRDRRICPMTRTLQSSAVTCNSCSGANPSKLCCRAVRLNTFCVSTCCQLFDNVLSTFCS